MERKVMFQRLDVDPALVAVHQVARDIFSEYKEAQYPKFKNILFMELLDCLDVEKRMIVRSEARALRGHVRGLGFCGN